jgi:FKBP-type peptidyl-prolyl cis-trans isomerase
LSLRNHACRFADIELGTGPKAWRGAMCQVGYTGKLESGRVFDSSRPGRPFGFTLGAGEGVLHV